MKKSTLIEFVILAASAFFLLMILFIYAFASPYDELVLETTFTEMPVATSIIYFWLFLIFTITLVRQLILKFSKQFTNLILIISGSMLFYLFHIFANNARSKEITIKGNIIKYEVHDYTTGVICYRTFQFVALVVVIISLVKYVKSNKMHSA
jgi:hypothetical protein